MAYHRGAELVRGHSVAVVCRELDINGELEAAALRLDQYYIPTRATRTLNPQGLCFDFSRRLSLPRHSGLRLYSWKKQKLK